MPLRPNPRAQRRLGNLLELCRKRWLRGLEATYTEHDFIMSERGLKNHCTGNRAVGSNATLSAILRLK